MSTNAETQFLGIARGAAYSAGVTGAASLVLALGSEIVGGETLMDSPVATLAGWLGYIGAALLVLGIAGFIVRFTRELPAGAVVAASVMLFATAITVGSSATLALLVPSLAEAAPELAASPPAVVPATFILSGAVMGICGVVVAAGLRRSAPWLPRAAQALLIAGSVVAVLPLPSRYFVLALAVAVLIGARADHRENAPSQAPKTKAAS